MLDGVSLGMFLKVGVSGQYLALSYDDDPIILILDEDFEEVQVLVYMQGTFFYLQELDGLPLLILFCSGMIAIGRVLIFIVKFLLSFFVGDIEKILITASEIILFEDKVVF